MRIYRTTRTCTLRDKIYVTYQTGAAFGVDWKHHTQYSLKSQVSYTTKTYSTASSQSLDADGSSQKRQDSSAFVLPYSLRLRSCGLMGAFILSPLPPVLTRTSCAVRPLRSTGVTPLRHYYGPRRHRLAFSRFPGLTGYTTYLAPPISRWGEDGFSSCLACPCYRAVPTTPLEECASPVSLRHTLLPSPRSRGLDLQSENYRGHLWVLLRIYSLTARLA